MLGAKSLILAAFIMLPGFGVQAAEPEPARKAELLYRLKHDCGSCHGMTLKGGLGPSLLPAAIKQHSNEFLIDVIRDGVVGTPMPPWGFELSLDETAWLVKKLKAGETSGKKGQKGMTDAK
jgi:cytochrome c55X